MSNDDLAKLAAAGARKREDAAQVENAEEDEWLKKQRAEDAKWLAKACTPPSRGWRDWFRRPKPDVDGERAWLGALPFRVVKYERFFSDRCNQEYWQLRLQFAGAAPDPSLLTNLFANIAAEVCVSSVTMTPDRRDPYARLAVPPEIDSSWDRNWLIRLLFHRVADEVLRPLHAQYPLTAVEPLADPHLSFKAEE